MSGALSEQVEQRQHPEGWKVLGDGLDIISEVEEVYLTVEKMLNSSNLGEHFFFVKRLGFNRSK